jgi:hypothetical protein
VKKTVLVVVVTVVVVVVVSISIGVTYGLKKWTPSHQQTTSTTTNYTSGEERSNYGCRNATKV